MVTHRLPLDPSNNKNPRLKDIKTTDYIIYIKNGVVPNYPPTKKNPHPKAPDNKEKASKESKLSQQIQYQ